MERNQKLFTSQADNMIRAVSDAMEKLKHMQECAADHLNIKTEVLKHDADERERQYATTEGQVSRLWTNAQSVETASQAATQKAMIHDDQIKQLDMANQRMISEMQQMSEQMVVMQQKMTVLKDDQMRRDIDAVPVQPISRMDNADYCVNESTESHSPSTGNVVFGGSDPPNQGGRADRNLRHIVQTNVINDGYGRSGENEKVFREVRLIQC